MLFLKNKISTSSMVWDEQVSMCQDLPSCQSRPLFISLWSSLTWADNNLVNDKRTDQGLHFHEVRQKLQTVRLHVNHINFPWWFPSHIPVLHSPLGEFMGLFKISAQLAYHNGTKYHQLSIIQVVEERTTEIVKIIYSCWYLWIYCDEQCC